jgi:hypothetical protein
LILALEILYFVLLARFGLLSQNFFELIGGGTSISGHMQKYNDEVAHKDAGDGFHDVHETKLLG